MNSIFEILARYSTPKYRQQMREHLRTPLYSNSYLLIINQGLSAILGFLYWTIAARFYSAQVVGKSSALISTLILLSMLAELSLKSAMQRFVPRTGQQVRRLILVTYGVSLLATGLLTVGFIFIGAALHISDNLLAGMSPTTLALLVLATMLWTVFFIQDGVLMGLRQAKWVLLENTIYNAGKIVLIVIGITGVLGDGIVASWFLPTTLVILVVNVLIFTRFIPEFGQIERSSIEPVQRHELVTSIVGDHVGTILAEISTRILPLLVVDLIGAAANAYFYQAWLISSMIYAVAVNIGSSFTVEASADLNRIRVYSRKTLRYMALMVLPMTLALIAIAPFILKIYGGDYSQQGTPVLRWLALAALPYGLNAWFLAYARVKADVKAIIWNQGLQCLIVLGLSYWWMRGFGITAIGIAWLVAQIVAALIVFLQTRRLFFQDQNSGQNEPKPGFGLQLRHPEGFADVLEGLPVAGDNAMQVDQKEMANIFLSPHLDDAVLSCGGLMSRLASHGERVILTTVFTGDVPEEWQLSFLARRNLRAWGLDEAVFRSAFRLRRMEDEAAAERLGVETVYLGLLDAMYRPRQDGSPFYTLTTVGVPVDGEDVATTGQTLQTAFAQLALRYSTTGPLRIFSPICVGQHVDHILVRCSAEAVFGSRNLIFYEDHPYAAHPGVHIQPEQPGGDHLDGSWVLTHIALSQDEIEARVDATACYSSQIPGLFPSPTERILEILSVRVPIVGSRIWGRHWRTLNYENSRKRMANALQTYISRTGGENYWHLASPEE